MPLEQLLDVVSSSILERATEVSQTLERLGVPHALIGGLAVGVHGYPRGTKDVDFLVGAEAFVPGSAILVYRDELKELARVGETDIMSVPPRYPALKQELRRQGDVPVISLEALVLMKLDANRGRDRSDVRELLARRPDRLSGVRDYLVEHAPELLPALGEVLVGR